MLIRNQSDLHKHLKQIREPNETDAKLAARLGIHVNTLAKLKHGTGMFDTNSSMKVLGLQVAYEVVK